MMKRYKKTERCTWNSYGYKRFIFVILFRWNNKIIKIIDNNLFLEMKTTLSSVLFISQDCLKQRCDMAYVSFLWISACRVNIKCTIVLVFKGFLQQTYDSFLCTISANVIMGIRRYDYTITSEILLCFSELLHSSSLSNCLLNRRADCAKIRCDLRCFGSFLFFYFILAKLFSFGPLTTPLKILFAH